MPQPSDMACCKQQLWNLIAVTILLLVASSSCFSTPTLNKPTGGGRTLERSPDESLSGFFSQYKSLRRLWRSSLDSKLLNSGSTAADSTATNDPPIVALQPRYVQRRTLLESSPCLRSKGQPQLHSRDSILFPSGSAAAAVSSSSTGGQVLLMKVKILPVMATKIERQLEAGGSPSNKSCGSASS